MNISIIRHNISNNVYILFQNNFFNSLYILIVLFTHTHTHIDRCMRLFVCEGINKYNYKRYYDNIKMKLVYKIVLNITHEYERSYNDGGSMEVKLCEWRYSS